MKQIDITTLITDERAEELRNDPIIKRLMELGEKVDSGKATAEELAEYNKMVEPATQLDPDVIEE